MFDLLAQTDVKPAEIVTFVGLFDENTYQDATQVLERFIISQTPSKRGRPHSNSKSGGDIQNKVKDVLSNTQGGIQGIEKALHQLSGGKNSGINLDDMLIAFNRVNAVDLGLDEVRDFYSSVKGAHRSANEGDLNIDEIMQVLNA